MDKKVEVSHMAFLRHIMGMQAQQIVDETWDTSGAGVVREAVGTQSEMIYIGRQQATVAQWVALQPIFELCVGEKGYEGGRSRREPWWRQEATEKRLQETFAGVSMEEKRRRLQGE